MLHLHRASRADVLLDALGEVLLQPGGDPMEREVVAVPTRGVERWLTQRLSHRLGSRPGTEDGVCANIDFPFPGALVARAMASACGAAALARDEDPWAPERCVWALVQLVDAHLDEDFLRPLAAHLRASSPRGAAGAPRRFTVCRALADLYDRYAVHRPEMLLAWKDHAEGPLATAAGRPHDVAWQAELWRRLRLLLDYPSPAERFAAAPRLIESGPQVLDLPGRISLFGLTRLPAGHLRVLKAISAHRQVHLFLLHPSEVLWSRIAAACPAPAPPLLRADDPVAREPRNPLLRSWGRDAREMQLVLASEGLQGGEHRTVARQTSTLLGLVQADIRADREPPGPPATAGAADARPLLRDGDDSLRVHSCHGRARQVEVVREAVLHLLEADPTLEPRDVIIMCPDIELFAPLVQASFGEAVLAGAPALRARLADRSLRQTNPLLAVAAHLLDLAGSRVTAAEVLDFASRDPVSRRFGFDQDELSQIERWLAATGVYWGLDGPHRAPWKLEALATGTWRAGLDRLLLGVAMSEEDGRLFGHTLPFGDVSSGEIDLVGRLAELIERLRSTLNGLSGRQAPRGWAEALATGTERLALPPVGDTWQAEQFQRALDDAAEDPRSAAPPRPVLLDLSEARALFADRLKGRPTRANFRTGDLTICTLVPMRSVPHRVVCLLGLDDGLFPRSGDQAGDNLLLARPQVGEGDVPSEDRQLLLDALLAATEHVVITFEGRDQHLNQPRPPSVPVSELLDVVDRTVRLTQPWCPARTRVIVQHPLQPFDPRNFLPGELGCAGPWRFDRAHLDGARALTSGRHAPLPFLAGKLEPQDSQAVQLTGLVRFLEHPVRAFLRERLGLYAGDTPEQLRDSLPLELAPLERWALGDRLLEARLAGASMERARAAERGRGLLPPGALGEAALEEVLGVVEVLVAEVERLGPAATPAVPVEVNISLPDGSSLVGTVPGVRRGTILRCTYSKLRPKHRLRAWAQFLALSASHPDMAPAAVTIGQAEGSTPARPRVSTTTLGPLAPDHGRLRLVAMETLVVLVDLYRRGMREPLPLYCSTSAAWAAATRADDSPFDSARRRWSSSYDDFPGEDADPEHVVVLGPAFPFEELAAAPPAADEAGRGWLMSETHRLGRLATRLWTPLLDHETSRER